jgi:hypothetical protein
MLTLTACAGIETTQDAQNQSEKEYVTGSNIPRKNRSDSPEVKAIDGQALRDTLDRVKSIPPARN